MFWTYILFQVGKVLIYDLISMRIILLPVPEHPIIMKETDIEDELDTPVDISPYKEDGSLEVIISSISNLTTYPKLVNITLNVYCRSSTLPFLM